mmetsp:Transcript_19448/g.46902  ORF Transcript_19448/g.46902 Transcript_19448/m.46902 type:complete len:219 (-) Transcript_19448:551-1207(-)
MPTLERPSSWRTTGLLLRIGAGKKRSRRSRRLEIPLQLLPGNKLSRTARCQRSKEPHGKNARSRATAIRAPQPAQKASRVTTDRTARAKDPTKVSPTTSWRFSSRKFDSWRTTPTIPRRRTRTRKTMTTPRTMVARVRERTLRPNYPPSEKRGRSLAVKGCGPQRTPSQFRIRPAGVELMTRGRPRQGRRGRRVRRIPRMMSHRVHESAPRQCGWWHV